LHALIYKPLGWDATWIEGSGYFWVLTE
jgi:hypothetical protein